MPDTRTCFQAFTHQIVERAQEHPDATALIFDDRRHSYAELVAAGMRIRERLDDLSLPLGSAVGVCVERSPAMVAAMLGILFAGHAYVPLDPTSPADRTAVILETAGISTVVGGAQLMWEYPVQHQIDAAQEWADTDREAPWKSVRTSLDQLAYTIFTSGSTGQPKGVRIPHGAVSNFLASMAQRPGMTATDRMLAVTTIGFDISVLELFLPLTLGATVVLASEMERLDGRALSELVEQHNITIMQATPSTWRIMLANAWAGKADLKILCGGEPLDTRLAQDLLVRSAELWNMYGPTETTVWSTCAMIRDKNPRIHVGSAIASTDIAIIDADMKRVAEGETGELCIGGAGLALGYTDASLNADRFVMLDQPGLRAGRYYRTGDLAVKDAGELRILGRMDDQVKVAGHRIELDEVRNALRGYDGLDAATVVALDDETGGTILAGVYQPSSTAVSSPTTIRAALSQSLPGYMIPMYLFESDAIPLTSSGKVDNKACRTWAAHRVAALRATETVQVQLDIASLILESITNAAPGLELGPDDDFFDAGLTSLQANMIAADLSKGLTQPLSVATLFAEPTVRQLSQALQRHKADRPKPAAQIAKPRAAMADDAVAIVGMAVRVPGADTLDDFWEILKNGRETVHRFDETEDDLVVPERMRKDPRYIRARGMIRDPGHFDAKLFGISPTDAMVMDPQQRVFLELAWEAMENAGCSSDTPDRTVGVYAGMGNNSYFLHNVFPYPDLTELVGDVQIEIGREKDHIATLVSHKLNLKGPSISLNTACSTGLVAIDQAWHSLRSGQCDVALAGAINLRTPQMSGQISEPGGIFSDDGHCRPFSDDSSGTMFSDSAGIVILKRLLDAVTDKDRIYGVIRGSAVNHDGRDKKSYLAPSINAQSDVIRSAQARAEIEPGQVSYVEAHGTATPVGDPIEFEALQRVFADSPDRTQYCALGSVKANLGHPTTAAGVVGVIKVALMMQHRAIPAQINFGSINRNIDIEKSPFFITTKTIDWTNQTGPRRAGVSSFGFCGTNAHVVLEEAPVDVEQLLTEHSRPLTLVVNSAASEASLAAHHAKVMSTVDQAAPTDVQSLAYSMAVDRVPLEHRSMTLLDKTGRARAIGTAVRRSSDAVPQLGFVFPGQGTQYVGMGVELYAAEPLFRTALQDVNDALMPHLGQNILDVMWSTDAKATERLNNTAFTQPAIFSVGYALAVYLQRIGILPDVMLGHSIGEITAATVAEVFSLEDAAKLIVARGQIMATLEPGSMLAVPLEEAAVRDTLPDNLSIAAINAPANCVVGGRDADIDVFAETLRRLGHDTRKLRTSHAFHSWMMEPGLRPFGDVLDTIALHAPSVPIISTVTGKQLSDAEARDKAYWKDHIRKAVRFTDAIAAFWDSGSAFGLELGPRNVLTTLASRRISDHTTQRIVPVMGDIATEHGESRTLTEAVGALWAQGISVDWGAYFDVPDMARRVTVPAYAFDRKLYWVDAPEDAGRQNTAALKSALRSAAGSSTESDGTGGDTGVLPQLLGLLSSVSGEAYDTAPRSASLSELGFDSLLLTPVAHLVKQTFGVKISLLELATTVSTLDAICARIGSEESAQTPETEIEAENV